VTVRASESTGAPVVASASLPARRTLRAQLLGATENLSHQFARYLIVGLGLNEGIIWFAREKIHLHYLVAKLISAGIVLMWSFGARKVLLFR